MKNAKGYQRLVCGLLTAQLCCAPLAQAVELTRGQEGPAPSMYSRAEERLAGALAAAADRTLLVPDRMDSPVLLSKNMLLSSAREEASSIAGAKPVDREVGGELPSETADPAQSEDEAGGLPFETTESAQPEGGEDRLPPETTEILPSEDEGSQLPPETTETTPPESGDSQLPPETTETTPPEGGEDRLPPETTETTPPEGGDGQLPPETTETTPPEGGDGQLPPETTETPPSEDEGSQLPPEATETTPSDAGKPPFDMEAPMLPPEAGPLSLRAADPLADAKIIVVGAMGYGPYYKETIAFDSRYLNKVYNVEHPVRNNIAATIAWGSGMISSDDGWYWYCDEYDSISDIDLSGINDILIRVPNLEPLDEWVFRKVSRDEDIYDDWFSRSGAEDEESALENANGLVRESSDRALDWSSNNGPSFTLEDPDMHALWAEMAGEGDGRDFYAVFFTRLWEMSGNADITDLKEVRLEAGADEDQWWTGAGFDHSACEFALPLYQDAIADKAAAELGEAEGFDSAGEEYYLRLNADQQQLRLALWTYEPGSTVAVTGVWGGESLEVLLEDHTSVVELSDSVVLQQGEKRNSLDNPARGRWDLTIPLRMAEGENQYNDVTIVVTPPSGLAEDEKSYTLHIQRMNQPQMSYESGNTPAAILGGNVDDFKENPDWTDNPPATTDIIYRGVFAPQAWGTGENVDLDSKAVIVYQNSKVSLPPLSMTDSRGMSTDWKGTLTRTLKLKTADPLTTDAVSGGPTREQYYTDGKLRDDPTDETIVPGQTEELDLRKMNVVPGVYSLEYHYADPLTGETYSSDGSGFETVGVDNAAGFSRTLVVLPLPGDVDMDGHVTAADGVELSKLLSEKDPGEIDPLFLYRVCDVDHNGLVDQRDLETLYMGIAGRENSVQKGETDYFYNALEGGEALPERKPAPGPVEEAGAGKAYLSVEYLGKGEGYEPPDAVGPEGPGKVTLNDCFWMGVKLEGAQALSGPLGEPRSFTVTLLYNPGYVQPYEDNSYEAGDLIQSACKGLWGDGASCYVQTADRGTADPGKGIPTLGKEGALGGALRELQVTVVCPEGAVLRDGYILKVPFRVKMYPPSGRLVELVFGPRELCFAGEEGTGLYSTTDIFGASVTNIAGLVDYGGTDQVSLGEDTTEAVLYETVTYGNALSGKPSRPLGEPNLDSFPEGGWLQYTQSETESKLTGTPPACGTYQFYIGNQRYKIEVVQAELKLYFLPQERYYGEENPGPRFAYDEAQLSDWDRERLADIADPTEKIMNLSGYEAPQLTYYATKKNWQYDWGRKLVTTDSDATESASSYYTRLVGGALHDYKIIYVDEKGDPVVEPDENGDPANAPWQTLKVKKRPILVATIKDPEDGYQIHENLGGQEHLTGIHVTYGGTDADQFTVQSPATNGVYNGLALTGDPVYRKTDGSCDKLELKYNASYVPDHTSFPIFDLTHPVEEREVLLTQMTLTGGDNDSISQNNNQNYVLANEVYMEGKVDWGKTPIVRSTKGRVVKRYNTSLEIYWIHGQENKSGEGLRNALTWTHGDELWGSLIVRITDNGYYSSPNNVDVETAGWSQLGLSVFLAGMGKDGKPEGERIEISTETGSDLYASHTDMDGLYIWVSAESYTILPGQDPAYKETPILDHSYYPLTVNQKEVTLSIEGEERYYGEEDPAQIEITYPVTDIPEIHRDGMTGDFYADFSGMDGYVPPEVKRVTSLTGSAEPVGRLTAASDYYVTIDGAKTADYKFKYTCVGKNGETSVDDTRGYNILSVRPRPIMVEKITANPEAIYQDVSTDGLTLNNQKASTAKGEVKLRIPTEITPMEGGYRYRTGQPDAEGKYPYPQLGRYEQLLPMTGSSPLIGEDQLTFTYRARYIEDSASQLPYFNLTQPEEEREVWVSCLELEKSATASNYEMVFSSSGKASYGYPGISAIDLNEEYNNPDYRTTGTVKMREVKSIEVQQLPCLSYTHGESLMPWAGGNLPALKIKITYDDKAGSSKIVECDNITFAEERLHLTWDRPWTGEEEKDRDVYIPINEMPQLTHAEHDGRKLYVTLEQLGDRPPISIAQPMTVTVAKKTLTLTIQGQNRYYGEPNEYRFTFNPNELALVDQKYLTDSGEKAEGSDIQSAALTAINEPYQKLKGYVAYTSPTFSSEAKADSPANSHDDEESYEVSASGGALTNYTLAFNPGEIKVYRRPVVVWEITAEKCVTLSKGESASGPVTVTRTLVETGSGTQMKLGRGDATTVEGSTKPGGLDNSYDDPDFKKDFPTGARLPLTGGALLQGDTLTITFDATFPRESERPSIPEGKDGVECDVTVSKMKLSQEDDKKYILVYKNSDQRSKQQPVTAVAKGWLGELKMTSIELWRGSPPELVNYNYGDCLTEEKLSKLTLNVDFGSGKNPIDYDGIPNKPELYYWDPSWEIPTTQEGLAALQTEKADYRVEVGERMTIAPNDKGVAHHGMRLMLLYRESPSDTAKYLPPVLTSPIQVKPKALTYTVSVKDKPYDGNQRAEGKLILTPTDIYEGDKVALDEEKLRFLFVSADVAYVTPPVNDNYEGLEIAEIPVEVFNIGLLGKDRDNYSINSLILKDWRPDVPGRPEKAPTARILKAEQSAPDISSILLSTDIHTNLVTVSPEGAVAGDGTRLEYALEYHKDGETRMTGWQTVPWFGGERVSKGDSQDPSAQPAPSGDTGFGLRAPLERGSWHRALVRVAESWNYRPSPAVLSVEGDLAQLAEEAQQALDALPAPDPEAAPAARPAGALTRTYQYRLDILSSSDQTAGDTGPITSRLEAVWFTDEGEYAAKEELDRALDNVKEKRDYKEYFWDKSKKTTVAFPLDFTAPLVLEIEQEHDGEYVKEEVQVNREDTVTFYVAAQKRSGGGSLVLAQKLVVSQTEVQAVLGDEPLQLTVTCEPDNTVKKFYWKSSDPKVVQVDQEGLLTFVGVGEAVVTVSAAYGGISAEVYVVVTPPELPSPNLTFTEIDTLNAFMDVDSQYRFRPAQTMTRGEVVLLLSRIFRVPEGTEAGAPVTFSDVNGDEAYASAVEMFSAYGIVKGVENGNFEGERIITRAEAVVLLARMLCLAPEQAGTTPVFLDGGWEDTWAAPYLNVLYRAGVIQGVGDGYFSPDRELTRAEMAAFVARILSTRADLASAALVIPIDVTDEHWAYESILRAVNSGETLMVIETGK